MYRCNSFVKLKNWFLVKHKFFFQNSRGYIPCIKLDHHVSLLPCLNQQRLFFLFLYNVFSFFLIHVSSDISKDSIIKVFCFLSISSRCRTSPKHKMRLSSPHMVMENRTEQFFIKFVSAILNIGFPQNFPRWHFTCEREEIISISPVKRENNGKTIFIWTAPQIKSICVS